MDKEDTYWYILDPYPQETEEHNQLYKFFDYLREGKLTSTKCKDCGALLWPPRTICRECTSDNLEWVEYPQTAKIYAFTVQTGGIPPGYKAPLIYALIDFANGKRMFALITGAKPEEVKIGSEVELEVLKIPNDRVMPGFRLKK